MRIRDFSAGQSDTERRPALLLGGEVDVPPWASMMA